MKNFKSASPYIEIKWIINSFHLG